MVRHATSETPDSAALVTFPGWDDSVVLHLSTARGDYNFGCDSDPVSVSAAGRGCSFAATQTPEEAARLPDATIPVACPSGSRRILIHPVLASEFFSRD